MFDDGVDPVGVIGAVLGAVIGFITVKRVPVTAFWKILTVIVCGIVCYFIAEKFGGGD